MKVLFFVVNYQSDDCLLRLLPSVKVAEQAAPGTDVRVVVLDNTRRSSAETEAFQSVLSHTGVAVSLVLHETNNGYFGGLPTAQKLVGPEVDVVLYGNPDIRLEPDFFSQLATCRGVAGLLAPSILDEQTGYNQNPKYVTRLSAGKLKRLRFLYGNDVVYALFLAMAALKEALLALKQRHRAGKASMAVSSSMVESSSTAVSSRASESVIYAPHGALFVFTDVPFFKGLPPYPCFLFGEELFVAEEAAAKGVVVRFVPQLRVMDTRHASISLLGLSRRRRYYLDSVVYILEQYYQE